MTADARALVALDKRFPASLTGDAGKALVVNPGETAYVHGIIAAQHHNDIIGGDATVSANTLTFLPCGAWDSGRTVYLETTGNKTVALPTDVAEGQTKFYVFLVRLVADASHEFRAYTSKAAVESDAEVSYYRYRTPWRTLATGVAIQAVLVGNILAFSKTSENRSTQVITNSYAEIDHTDLFDPSDILEIRYGSYEPASSEVFCTTSLNGVDPEVALPQTRFAPAGDADGIVVFPFTTTRKFKLSTTAANFRLTFRVIKLRL